MRRKQMLSSADAKPGKKQHTKPCSDCPMARAALNGWLGGSTPDEYLSLAHSDHAVSCHVTPNMHCAGMGIYRANVCKSAEFRLPVDRETVFATPMEFKAHHSALPKTKQKR